MDFGIKAGSAKFFSPKVVSLLVEFARIARGFVRRINSRVQAVLRKFPNFGDEFPGPFDRFLFEVIAEGPIAKHFEKRVVIRIQPDVFEVVMLAAGSDALLGVGGARVLARDSASPFGNVWRALPQKNRHELVHAGVGKKQVRRVGHQTRRRHDRVLLRFLKIEEGLAYFRTRHWLIVKSSY